MSLFCVFSDLLITLLLYISLICLKNFQDLTKEDVQEHLLTADDFSICIKSLPPAEETDVKELKAYFHSWVENIMRNEDNSAYLDPDTQ